MLIISNLTSLVKPRNRVWIIESSGRNNRMSYISFEDTLGIIQKVRSSCRGGRGVLKKRTKTNRGKGGSSLSVSSLCENICLIFKQ